MTGDSPPTALAWLEELTVGQAAFAHLVTLAGWPRSLAWETLYHVGERRRAQRAADKAMAKCRFLRLYLEALTAEPAAQPEPVPPQTRALWAARLRLINPARELPHPEEAARLLREHGGEMPTGTNVRTGLIRALAERHGIGTTRARKVVKTAVAAGFIVVRFPIAADRPRYALAPNPDREAGA